MSVGQTRTAGVSVDDVWFRWWAWTGPRSKSSRLVQHRLKHEDMASILAEVMAMAAGHPDPMAAHDHLAYLVKRVEQMAYPTFQAAGWSMEKRRPLPSCERGGRRFRRIGVLNA
jgi:hypothetical protein